MNKQVINNKGMVVAVALIYIVVLLVGGLGWIFNVIALCKCDFEAPIKEEVIRTIGVFVVPVGMIAGWFDIDSKEQVNDLI